MGREYNIEHAEVEAEQILKDVMKRENYISQTRDALAETILAIVKRELKGNYGDRPLKLKVTSTKNRGFSEAPKRKYTRRV